MKNTKKLVRKIRALEKEADDIKLSLCFSEYPERPEPDSDIQDFVESWFLTEVARTILDNMDTFDVSVFLSPFVEWVDADMAEDSRRWMLQCLDTCPEAPYTLGSLLYLFLESYILGERMVIFVSKLAKELKYILPPKYDETDCPSA